MNTLQAVALFEQWDPLYSRVGVELLHVNTA